MNWFDTSGFTSLAKKTLKEAQKTLDKALDIQEGSSDEQTEELEVANSKPASGTNTPQKEGSDFLSSWGLTSSAESAKDGPIQDQPVVTASPSKAATQSLWGSFAGSFFEPAKSDTENTIVKPPKAKSMNVISDTKYSSEDDLFSKSQLLISDLQESGDGKNFSKVEEVPKSDDRRDSSRSNQLSLVSSRNSSDSVEVLSQSLKTTPDSEVVSVHSVSHSSSMGLKFNSESVEILPDSLVSPSIECIGFDSCSSSSLSSNLSPGESSDKKSLEGDKTEQAEGGDSVSLVDDEDTMSYNSVSECTAPTILDTDDKLNINAKLLRNVETKKFIDKEIINLENTVQKMQVSANSSNDGSWSDHTLHADNETLEDQNRSKESETDDIFVDKLSDSSSIYNVTLTRKNNLSDSTTFVNVENNDNTQKGCTKERTSPISSDSKSDLVKIGSDRTSGHTSGDELETATSSDIEIIPSPNGEFCRVSPGKCPYKQKDDNSLVDMVLGKSLATKIRGHNRELSETSITSDESQSSENERLMRRLCEVSEVLDARENRLMEMTRSYAELMEANAELKVQLETLRVRNEGVDSMNEDYTQRMSALERKFQQAIRDKDQLRKQLDTLKHETARKPVSQLESTIQEKNDMISQLQEEGEKLSRQQLQHSNIIKKLRAKEKDNEQVIKSLRDKICELSSELERVKRAVSAKEELEVTQIEAVYRLTTTNKRLEAELVETKSNLDDTSHKLQSSRLSLDAARKELSELQRFAADTERARLTADRVQAERDQAVLEADELRHQLLALRTERVQEEKRWQLRHESTRRELAEARELASSLEACRGAGGGAGGGGTAALLGQLAALQASAVQRDTAHASAVRTAARRTEEAEIKLAKAVESDRLTREENVILQERAVTAEGLVADVRQQLRDAEVAYHTQLAASHSKIKELEQMKSELESEVEGVRRQLADTLTLLETERAALDTERKRNSILTEQLSSREEISPSQSVTSEAVSLSFWPQEAMLVPPLVSSSPDVGSLSELVSRRNGEIKSLTASIQDLKSQRTALSNTVASLQHDLLHYTGLQEQYDALLEMYGEKEEQLEEVRLDLQDVTHLYKAQLADLIRLRETTTQ